MSKGPWKKKLGLAPSGDVAPKQKRASPKKKVTMEMVGALVDLINLPLNFIVPQYALSQSESDALTVAITDLAGQNVWVNNLIYTLVSANTAAELPIVLGAVVTNKLIVAEKVPPMAAVATESILEAVAMRRGKGKANAMATGGARSSDWSDGIGQDNAGARTPEVAPVYPLPDNEAGHVSMAEPVEARKSRKAN